MTIKKHQKIAILATVTDFGGAEKVVLSLIKNIHGDRFELVPIIFTRNDLCNNTFLKALDKTKKKYHTIYANNYKLKYLNPLVNIFETYKFLKSHDFDLIHTHGHRADVIGLFLSKLTRLPLISTCHGFLHTSSDLKLKIYIVVDRIALKFFNKIMAVSDGIKYELIKSGIPESRVLLIQNAVESNSNHELNTQNRYNKRKQLNIQEEEFVVGYIGRLSEEKGVKYLLEASSTLNGPDMALRTIIIGDGPQRKELEDFVKKANIGDRTHFVGFQDDIENWLPAIDVFALPSLTEGTPMALLEAMAYGIPVIASGVGGVLQVINSEKNGILVSPGKPEEIRNAIRILYKDEALRNRLSEEAQNSIRLKYDVKNWISKIETEYLKIVNKN